MTHHWDFFKQTDRSFGMFYPKNYVVAGFDSEEHAKKTEQQFLDAGFAREDVRAAAGWFVVNQVEKEHEPGWIEQIGAQIAKVVGTEVGYIEDDLKLARRGGAFLFVFAPDDETTTRATHLLKLAHPVFARRYLPFAIERLIYPPQTDL
ncbi:MAG TPA: hypothetical protein VFG55_02935 [Rhodanobacteraceae bacterium]|nr:hypothetical protein [Rhodanobacteraceae bacterium]